MHKNLKTSVLFVQVILPLPLRTLFTYSVPPEFHAEVKKGKRVIVQFGAHKFYAAVIYSVHSNPPENFRVKDLISVMDEVPLVNELQLRFWDWIASYYMCSAGEVMKAALPSGLKLESETRLTLNTAFEPEGSLTGSEELILQLVSQQKSISVDSLAKSYNKRDLLKIIKQLVEHGALFAEETLSRHPEKKTETFIELMPHLNNEEALKAVFDRLAKAPRQLDVLMKFIHASGYHASGSGSVSRKSLLSEVASGADALRSLVKKGVFRETEIEVTPLKSSASAGHVLKPLSDFQAEALREIRTAFEKKPVVLLHGYTASGKTELYIHLIDEQIKTGKQVLYLLPEIALTTQIINRLKDAFGDRVGIYHSRFSDSERVGVWNGLAGKGRSSKFQVILGVRSSVFLPFDNLGLIIIDEEHENSYKQFDPAPRYHARDAALVLAQMHGARTLLGTATPSVDSYYNAENGKYALVELFQRYSRVELPEVFLVNTADARKRKQMKSFFHPELLVSIKQTLDRGKQVILFQNRRGFSLYIQCNVCAAIPRCKHCDVSMTYHKQQNLLVCHYCGYSTSRIEVCPACGAQSMKMHGFGTEKIEDELALFFPGRKIARMDLDSTRSRKNYEKLIHEFEHNNLDILVGTQMVTKGLDFDHVELVGILDAEQLLNYPDFRAYERSFQLMSQVSGRAGRKDYRGKVIIQTTDERNYILQDVIHNNFKHMYQSQLTERQQFGYPPFTKLIRLTVKHKDRQLLDEAADTLAAGLRKSFGHRIVGPEYPLIGRISNWYQKDILLKIERQASVSRAKEIIGSHVKDLNSKPDFRGVIVQPDVDPM